MTCDKIFLLGSECWSNIGLSQSKYRALKVFHSPFHGMRIIGPGVMPAYEFFKDSRCFYERFIAGPWEYALDGNDFQGYNRLLNIRKCHIDRTDPTGFIPKCAETEKFAESHETLFVIDLNDYMLFEDDDLKKLKTAMMGREVLCVLRKDDFKPSYDELHRMNPSVDIDDRRLSSKYESLCGIFSPTVIQDKTKYAALFDAL